MGNCNFFLQRQITRLLMWHKIEASLFESYPVIGRLFCCSSSTTEDIKHLSFCCLQDFYQFVLQIYLIRCLIESSPRMLDRTLLLVTVLRVFCFSSETMPFFPDDVTSTFGLLVGACASSGIVFQQASGCPVGGVGLGQKRRRCSSTGAESFDSW